MAHARLPSGAVEPEPEGVCAGTGAGGGAEGEHPAITTAATTAANEAIKEKLFVIGIGLSRSRARLESPSQATS